MSNVLDAEEAGRVVGTTARHVRHLARRQAIPHWRVGGQYRFDATELAEWLEERRVRPEAVTR